VTVDEPRGTLRPCQVHNAHNPRSHINEVHHVWPLGDGGPDITANKVTVCATGHNSIHMLLAAYRKVNGDPGWEVRRHFTTQERAYALIGWLRLSQQTMTPVRQDTPSE